MSKSICALVHRPGSSRAAFQAYYEDSHAPLAISLFPFTGYVRNHLVEPGDFGWDTISEFWSGDIAGAAALMNGPVGETMRLDEEKFMDRARIAAGGAEEISISCGAPADGERRRTVVLLNPAPGTTGFRRAALAWAATLGGGHGGVSIDFVTAWADPAFPAEAVVWLRGWPDIPDCEAGLTARTLRAHRHETPPGRLLGNAGKG